jgi:hypothetical protein
MMMIKWFNGANEMHVKMHMILFYLFNFLLYKTFTYIEASLWDRR